MGGASKFLMLLSTHPASSNIRFLSPLSPSSRSSYRHARAALLSANSRNLHSLSQRNGPIRIGGFSNGRVSQRFCTQVAREDFAEATPLFVQNSRVPSHPWPEWVRFVDHLRERGYFKREIDQRFGEEDGIKELEGVSDEFAVAVNACLGFAHDRSDIIRSLSRRDIEVIVENGSPFLFKDGTGSTRRMRDFLITNHANVLEHDKAGTIDLMRFLLSYASSPLVSTEGNEIQNKDLVEASVRKLLRELVEVTGAFQKVDYSDSIAPLASDKYGRPPRPLGQNIEMKRGDWICAKCSFMNFARNTRCLECDEARPKRQLTGGEWECPQCDFFNYGRNAVCLRCDCKCPAGTIVNGSMDNSYNTTPPNTNGYSPSPNRDQVFNSVPSSDAERERRLAENDAKAERWFSKVSQLNDASDLSSTIADEDFPEIMPLRKGVNRFVVSTRKTPLERRLANAQYRRNVDDNGVNSFNVAYSDRPTESSISESLDKILGSASNVSETCESEKGNSNSLSSETSKSEKDDNDPSVDWFSNVAKLGNEKEETPDDEFPKIMPMRKGESKFVVSTRKPPSERRLTSPEYRRNLAYQGNDAGYVPFTPLDPSLFGKKSKAMTEDKGSGSVAETPKSSEVLGDSSESVGSSSGLVSEKQVVKQVENTDSEPSDPSERWFKKVSELHDVNDLASAISDEDFPEIMPMRKGENRFVVSKKKDRSLTSPQYKRRLAMEQANSSSNFVPFVPFPPDYFAKKDKPSGSTETSSSATSGVSTTQETNKSDSSVGGAQQSENFEITREIQCMNSTGKPLEGPALENYGYQNSDNNMQNNKEREFGNIGFSERHLQKSAMQDHGYQQPPENLQSRRDSGFIGSSLEGSAMKDYGYGQRENFETRRESGYTGFTGKPLDGSGTNHYGYSQPQNLGSKRESEYNGFTGRSLEGSAPKDYGYQQPKNQQSGREIGYQQPDNFQSRRENGYNGFTGKALEGSVYGNQQSDNSQSKRETGYKGSGTNHYGYSQPQNLGSKRESEYNGFTGRSLEGSAPKDYGYQQPKNQQSGREIGYQQPDNFQSRRENGYNGFTGKTLDGSAYGNQQSDNSESKRESGYKGFTGKSLEGSAVKEPDPLDMSEEAKAERWFRRVAQIKDISELSQIPDEDFPEIMPMRKGVNRFVVSKRKTPLERRLTSPQYRRNLPVISSDPEKDKTN
ncbi:hypothetical protein AMTRI_Chr01g102440 [Amborella trichopoda]